MSETKTIQPPAEESSVVSAQTRLKSGRNEPCPCGSGRKYKKCCLHADEELVRRAAATSQSQAADQALATPLAEDGKSRKISETERRLDELWAWFYDLKPPSATQMDEFLRELLTLPPEATMWNDVLRACIQQEYPDLPMVFRWIAANVPHTDETGMCYFYWTAAEELKREDSSMLLPEVVAGYKRLDENCYDADVLCDVEDLLLADRFETETLDLAEHFLPIVRNDGGLMPYAVVEKCGLIFELRAGMALRGGQEATSRQAVVQALGRDIEEDIDSEAIDRAARVACETDEPDWSRACFDLVTGDIHESDQAWQDCLRLNDSLLRVAREAWRVDGAPPGWAFVGLSRLLSSVYRARNRDGAEPKRNKKRRTEPRTGNLLDYLNPAGMEQRIARASPGMLGPQVAQARILVDAHTLLLDLAERHLLIADGAVAASRTELARLRDVLDSV